MYIHICSSLTQHMMLISLKPKQINRFIRYLNITSVITRYLFKMDTWTVIVFVFLFKRIAKHLEMPNTLLSASAVLVLMEWSFVESYGDSCEPKSLEITFIEYEHHCSYITNFSPLNSTFVTDVLPITVYDKYYNLIRGKMLTLLCGWNLCYVVRVQHLLAFRKIVHLLLHLRDPIITNEQIWNDLEEMRDTYRLIYRLFLALFRDVIIFVSVNTLLYITLNCTRELDRILDSNFLYKKLYLEFSNTSITDQELPEFFSRTSCLEKRDSLFYGLNIIVLVFLLSLAVFTYILAAYRITEWFSMRNSTFNQIFGPPVSDEHFDWLCERSYLSWFYLNSISSFLLPDEIASLEQRVLDLL